MVFKNEVLKMVVIRCNLCGWETADDNTHGIGRHENHHEGTELFVMGRHGRQKRCRNRIVGKVKWLFT